MNKFEKEYKRKEYIVYALAITALLVLWAGKN